MAECESHRETYFTPLSSGCCCRSVDIIYVPLNSTPLLLAFLFIQLDVL